MQSANKIQFADEIKNKKYIDSYIDKWLKLDTLDKPYVECEICGYASNASIHQHANCDYELRALMDKYNEKSPEKMPQLCEEAFEKLKDKKKHYKEANQSLGRVEV